MSTYNDALRVSWPLQSVIAITLLVPLLGLAWQLKRPAAGALALGWLWTSLALLTASVDAFVGTPDGRSTPFVHALLAGCIGASVPAFVGAIDALIAERALVPLRVLVRQTFVWAVAFFAPVILVGALDHERFTSMTELPRATARALRSAAYLLVAVHALRRRPVAASQFHQVLLLLALAVVLQAARPLTTVMLLRDMPANTLTEARSTTIIVVNVFITTACGLACLAVALVEERAAVSAASRRLRDAAVSVERAHRLESVGRLATGVAHDFNNFLQIILGGADIARDRLAGGENPHDELQIIDEAARRGAALTRQLLTFARQQPALPVTFDAVQCVKKMSDLLERLVDRQTTLTVALPSAPLLVSMDATQFEQVLLNLVSNASHAITNGDGRITVQLGHERVAERRMLDVGELASGDYVALTVADNGSGIPADIMEQIFEPFFTTRQDDGGSGLGLATVYGIARQAGGDVTVTSAMAIGTTFTVLLPLQSSSLASVA